MEYRSSRDCHGVPVESRPVGRSASDPAAPAADSPYKGTTVRFLSAATVHQKALGKQLEKIGKEWGVQVDVRFVTTDQLAKKVVLDYVGGADTWDLVYTGGVQRMYEWADGGILQEMTPLIRKVGDPKSLEWEAFSDGARDASTMPIAPPMLRPTSTQGRRPSVVTKRSTSVA